MNVDYDDITKRIEEKGFAIIPKFLPYSVVDEYQRECERQFACAPRLEGKNYREGVTPNYTQPWVIDYEKRKVASERLYEFYHNPQSNNTRRIVEETLSVRDRIESRWPKIAAFNSEKNLHDYNIVARYAKETGFQAKHSDLDPTIPFPTVQCEILLTNYGDDYTGGHLRLYGYDGDVVEVHKDVVVEPGDLILFDKRLPHDVSATHEGKGRNKGRWMALIGAKTFPRSDSQPLRDFKKKTNRFLFLNAPLLHTLLKKAMGKSTEYEEPPMY